ncbi:MAG: hypothetical protein KF887_13770 [Paracoccaceae bacterium]|nr:MAG: hypothetical protein KF887_13770 [Paracoccaceae bacterium]
MSKEFPLVDDAVKKIVKKSRAMPVAFGFNPGTTDEDDEYLAAHVRKKPEMLGKLALHDGAGTKSAFGTFQAVGSEIHLTCFRTIPQLAKKIKRYLKRYKVTLNVVVMDPDGNVIDSDVEVLTEWFDESGDEDAIEVPGTAPDEAAEDAAADPVEAVPDPAADPAELAARLKALQPEVAAAPADVAARVAQGFAGAVALVRGGKLVEAESAISKLEMVVARLAMMRASAPPVAPPAPSPGDDQRLPKLRQAIEMLRGSVNALAGADALSGRLDTATGHVDAGEPEAAMGILREVQSGVAALQAARDKWTKAEAMVTPQVAQALSARSIADPDGLRTRWAFVTGLAADGAYDRALAALPQIVALLRSGPAAPEVAAGTVAFQKSRVLWVGARSRMMDEARKLADAIIAQSADDADAAEIAEAAQEILDEVAVIDDRLQDVLDRITEAPEGPARDGLKRQASTVLAEYHGLLGQGIFAVIDSNPFAAVSVTSRARAALDQVARTLAA